MKIEIYTASQDIPQLVDGSPLHSKRMFCLLESHTEARPIMIAAFDNDNKELGHILVVKYREWRLLPPGFHIWYTIHGQGVYSSECNDKEHLFKLLIDKLFDLFDFNHTLIDIRNLDDARFAYDTLSDKGFFPRRDRRMYISLHSKEPEKRLTRTYKANIRKAQKRGVMFREVNNTQEALVAIKMMRRYYASKIGRHLPPTKYLLHLLADDEGDKKTARLFAVYHKEKMIGCSICLYDKERVFLAYSCGLRKTHPLLYPGIMAVWAAITDAHKRGIPHFEFLEPQGHKLRTGYLNFILNFGCKQVTTLRWRHFKWNIINKIFKAIYV